MCSMLCFFASPPAPSLPHLSDALPQAALGSRQRHPRPQAMPAAFRRRPSRSRHRHGSTPQRVRRRGPRAPRRPLGLRWRRCARRRCRESFPCPLGLRGDRGPAEPQSGPRASLEAAEGGTTGCGGLAEAMRDLGRERAPQCTQFVVHELLFYASLFCNVTWSRLLVSSLVFSSGIYLSRLVLSCAVLCCLMLCMLCYAVVVMLHCVMSYGLMLCQLCHIALRHIIPHDPILYRIVLYHIILYGCIILYPDFSLYYMLLSHVLESLWYFGIQVLICYLLHPTILYDTVIL